MGAQSRSARYLAARRGRSQLTRPRVALSFLISLACLPLAAGCSGKSAQQREAQQLESLGIVSDTAPLGKRLIAQAEVNSASDAAAARTFLHMWSLLQYGATDQVAELFEPSLRDLIGSSLLNAALAGEQVAWQATKPKIISATVTNGTAVIRFLALDETGKVQPASISFRGGQGRWRVAYFSTLSGALQRTAQLGAQVRLDPLATKPNVEAVRQGYAAGGIQGVYLERQLRAGHHL